MSNPAREIKHARLSVSDIRTGNKKIKPHAFKDLMRGKVDVGSRGMYHLEQRERKEFYKDYSSSFENTTSMDNLPATRKNQLISIL